MATMLSDHFSLEEMIASESAARRGINNVPPPDIKANLKRLAAALEEVRKALDGAAIHVNSGYRCPALNRAIKGSKTSAHMTGLAADIIAPKFGTPLQLAKAIAKSGVEYDQIIYEFGVWVHFSIAPVAKPARGEKLSIFTAGKYMPGLMSNVG